MSPEEARVELRHRRRAAGGDADELRRLSVLDAIVEVIADPNGDPTDAANAAVDAVDAQAPTPGDEGTTEMEVDLPDGGFPGIESVEVKVKSRPDGSFEVTIGSGFVSVAIPVAVRNGQLVVDTSRIPDGLPFVKGSLKARVDKWVRTFNKRRRKKTGGASSTGSTGRKVAAGAVGLGMIGTVIAVAVTRNGDGDPAAAPTPTVVAVAVETAPSTPDATTGDAADTGEPENGTAVDDEGLGADDYIDSLLADATGSGIGEYTPDVPLALDCIGGSLTDPERGGTAEDLHTLVTVEYRQWPDAVVELYAAALEDCIRLEPYYMEKFSAFDYTRDGCPADMTAYVLETYSWAEFIRGGILDTDPAVRNALQLMFDGFVNNGYGINECFQA